MQVPSLRLQSAWIRDVETKTMKSLGIDIRVKAIGTHDSSKAWTATQSGKWINSTSILAHVANYACNLEAIHIRMSAAKEQVRLLEDLLSINSNVQDFVLEIDTGLREVYARPTLNLNNLSACNETSSGFRRFIIRAPMCNVTVPDSNRFLRQMSTATDVRIAAYRADVKMKSWQWVLQLMGAAKEAKEFEATFACEWNTALLEDDASPIAMMPRLLDLTLELPELDARLLRQLQAPMLQSSTQFSTFRRFVISVVKSKPMVAFPTIKNEISDIVSKSYEEKGHAKPRVAHVWEDVQTTTL
ncbi:hypothetical protein A4X13_0g7499 [Tilletia indica]|uniref:Uncharacterized protein n=1 Tax=Tilletia indica TaxID=43049 RepID=A0A8T8SIY9_9BASI|nr:hypothetical protein A4X13_0g7499 [Tilletia indica]